MATETIRVKAADPKKPVFLPGQRRRLNAEGREISVIQDELLEVPNERYYRRRIEAGDLIAVDDTDA